ncbi:MAG: M42 family metallopeptidase, partial [Promethearchaeota archaeon]
MDQESDKKKMPDIPRERKDEIFSIAKLLTDACSPTGFEDEIRAIIKSRLQSRCKLETDKMGNIYARIDGTGEKPRKKMMLSAHLDEIGFMVSFITKDGFLRIVPLGGQNYRILPGQRVTVFSKNGEFHGVIAEKPIHLLTADERKKLVKESEIFVDIGTSSKEETLELIAIGDYITFTRQCEWLGNKNLFSCKAADDRMGVLIELLVLEYFIENPPELDVIGVFSVQEEIGTRGAITSAYTVNPDAAITLEVTHA